MDRNDQDAIEQLFVKLREVEGRTGPRDPEAEALIRARIASQPGAPYYLAQTVVVQEQALEQAHQRIQELESRPQGGLLSGLFGGGRPAQPAYRQPQHDPRNMQAAPQRGGPWGGAGGGGFLAGAAQTAMGVAGGVVLGNMIAGMFQGDSANAAESSGGGGNDDFGGDDFGGGDGGGE